MPPFEDKCRQLYYTVYHRRKQERTVSVVLPVRLSEMEKKRAAVSAKRRGLPLATYLKSLLEKESSPPVRFEIGGKAPKIPKHGITRSMAYE
jgi:hypothetical protein